jgi:ribosomal protein S18 acetylase RimI-like enzyme
MITYRLATREDNEQLIELTASTGMMGQTGLRIDRHPDFFSLLDKRGESKVFIALDGNEIIGSLCVSLQQVWVGEQILPLHYIGDFKVAPKHRNMGIGLQLCNELANDIVPRGADLAFLNVSRGNNKPFSFFKNRPNSPDFDNIGIFKIHQFVGRRKKFSDPEFPIQEDVADEELIRFLNRHYSQYALGPVISHENLDDVQIFTIRDKTRIIAAMCLSDTMNMKQNVVLKLSPKLKWLMRILDSFSGLLGFSKMPSLNKPVGMLYIKYLAVDHCANKMVKLLINHARNIAYKKLYSFVSVGLHEKDPLQKCFAGLFKMSFHSVGMLVSIKNNRTLIEKVMRGIPFEDYSLV